MGLAGRITGPTGRSLLVALLFTGAALLVRLPGLAGRPFHTDEAVNAFILEESFQNGFQYRPHDHHGPSLFLLAAAVFGPLGKTHAADWDAWMLRLLPAITGAALAGVVYGTFHHTDRPAAAAAAAAVSLAAPFVYYSGIFIHELLLVLLLAGYFTTLWTVNDRLASGFAPVSEALRARLVGTAVLAGVCAGGMLATKETAGPILALVTFSALLVQGSALVRTGAVLKRALGVYLFLGVVAVGTVALLFSGLGRHPDRAFSLFGAIAAQISRGTGSEHAYPWWTYLHWLAAPTSVGIPWSGWILPAFAVLGAAGLRRSALARALVLWAVLLAAFFFAIPYKTPWLSLAWLLPIALLAGMGWARFRASHRAPAWVMAGGALALLGWETYARCQRFPVDAANPLAYSPSSPDLDRLTKEVERRAGQHPEGRGLFIGVVAQDYWPLPWYLRRFSQVGYWAEPPVGPEASLLFSGPEYVGHFSRGAATFQPFTLRPGVFLFLRDEPPVP